MSKGVFAVCVAALLCWASEAAADSVTEGSGTPDLKLLFVGNSLIYFNGGVHKVTRSPTLNRRQLHLHLHLHLQGVAAMLGA